MLGHILFTVGMRRCVCRHQRSQDRDGIFLLVLFYFKEWGPWMQKDWILIRALPSNSSSFYVFMVYNPHFLLGEGGRQPPSVSGAIVTKHRRDRAAWTGAVWCLTAQRTRVRTGDEAVGRAGSLGGCAENLPGLHPASGAFLATFTILALSL